MSQTKEQKAAYDKEYYIENKEAICDRVKTYQEDNREKRLAQQKEYREKNKKAINQYYENNKEQINSKSKEWHENNKEKVAAQNRKKKYGLSSETYNKMLEEQNNECKICLTSFTTLETLAIHVDHCHTTNKVRGILCRNCNAGLGHFKDNTKTLTKAINYLQENT